MDWIDLAQDGYRWVSADFSIVSFSTELEVKCKKGKFHTKTGHAGPEG